MSKVLHPSQLPTRLPIIGTLVAYMCMDMYDAPGWVIGMVWTLLGIIWICAIVAIYKEDQIKLRDLTAPGKPNAQP